VFLAEDTRLQRRVALKVTRPAMARDLVLQRWYQREAQATAAMNSDHVVTIYQLGRQPRRAPAFCMAGASFS